jgi:hypothetical protein
MALGWWFHFIEFHRPNSWIGAENWKWNWIGYFASQELGTYVSASLTYVSTSLTYVSTFPTYVSTEILLNHTWLILIISGEASFSLTSSSEWNIHLIFILIQDKIKIWFFKVNKFFFIMYPSRHLCNFCNTSIPISIDCVEFCKPDRHFWEPFWFFIFSYRF